MQRFLLRVLFSGVAVLLASQLFGELISVPSVQSALVFALVLGILNAFLRPILLLLSLPLTIVTLGLFTLVVNALVFWLASQVPGVGVSVQGFAGAFVGALTVSLVSFFASRAFK